jgi:hypothetical protein
METDEFPMMFSLREINFSTPFYVEWPFFMPPNEGHEVQALFLRFNCCVVTYTSLILEVKNGSTIIH